MKLKNLLILSIIGFISFSSCKKDDPVVPNEEELITTLNYTLTDSASIAPNVTLSFIDLDGDGGTAPTISNGVLTANTTYLGSLVLLNESETPSENITTEIQEEDEEHQFFFVTTVDGVSVTYMDQDSLGNHIGLSTKLKTEATGTGNLTITLKHEPTKPNNGTVADAGGETDIEVVFPISVQ